MKVGFGYAKSSFQGTNTETAVQIFFEGDDKKLMKFCANSTFPPFGAMCHTYPHLCFLKQMPHRQTIQGKFLQKSNTKNKFLEKIAAKIKHKKLSFKDLYPNLPDNCPPLVKTRKKIFPKFFFQKNILQFIFYKKSFFQICFCKKNIFFHFFFYCRSQSLFGTKNSKTFFFVKKYFPKLFLHKNIFFLFFFFTVEFSHFLGQKMKKKYFYNFGKYVFRKKKCF